ncbi:MAG: Flp pilus assembly complex ATPase component TadA [Candidatus Omnitrophica bacterium]|nr:Flp pilus assembly complex ATPase component TadA [Candidatus Omnitrophota bacterium]
MRSAKPLPELLVSQGILTPAQVQAAQAQATKSSISLKQAIIQQGVISEQDLTNLLAEQLGMTTIDLSTYLIRPEIVQLVPEALARKHTLVPVFKIGDTLTVAMDDPLNFFALDELRLRTKCAVKTVLSTATGIRQAIDQYYGARGVEEAAHAINEAALPKAEEALAEDAPVIRLVNQLILQAVRDQASDIHLEPGDGVLRTRFRVDGILREVKGPPLPLHSAIVSRIKVLSKLDIAEKRKSQDGRFRLKMEGHEVDLRVSTVPTQFGETVVLRLLNASQMLLSLPQLGLDPALQAQVEQLIHLPHGILLVTGPTGSGKTTTLYAALNLINDPARNILTIEDPVEYQLPGVNQVQVNPKADMTFASSLRSFLRQDPDVIMVGEIRDRETAEVAIQAALTGHLIFSTLHTNDAPGAIARLLDMGLESFLVASSVAGIIAQRLVRVICSKCKETYQPASHVLRDTPLDGATKLSRGTGCAACHQTGYKGRIGIFELLRVTEEIKNAIVAKQPAYVIREAARRGGMRTLREDGLAKVRAGVTTLEEVLRVTQLE